MSEVLSEPRAMETVWKALEPLDPSARQRVVTWLLGVLGMPVELAGTSQEAPAPVQSLNGDEPSSQVTLPVPSTVIPADLSPKAFISQKNPQSIVERITCLAFYLTHYRGTPHFNGGDIEKVNTQAAGSTINTTRDLDNASRAGYLAPAENRKRQISIKGEELVNALPDREAVKAFMAKYGPQRKRRASTKRREANGDAE
jgi:hypothetical protein